jgi:hypothetical protein
MGITGGEGEYGTAGSDPNPTGISYGQETVDAAGTAQTISPAGSVLVPPGFGVVVKALSGNAGSVYIGDLSVEVSTGFELQPGESVTYFVQDVATIFVDSDNNDDGVCWTVEAV